MTTLKNKVGISNDSALFSLLQDSNESVASLAMEQILQLPDFEAKMRNYQDTADPILRRRVHQLSNIARRRENMAQFMQSSLKGRMDIWRSMLLLDQLYDQQNSPDYLETMSQELIREFSKRRNNANSLTRFMREQDFAPATENWFDASNYLLGNVLESREGAPALLCIIAQHIASFYGLQCHIILYMGRFCLIDQSLNLIDPVADWKVHKSPEGERFHVCDAKAVLITIVSHLFAFAVVNWDPWEIHFFSKMLLSVAKTENEELPYPLGKYNSPPGTRMTKTGLPK
ncbi:MAG: hypothetical protein GX946_06085 [Oligosphaeraceae bacterium]|nr:hypothetical protein [Oligosphaeraceae bacterium]